MPSDRLTARAPLTPDVLEELREAVRNDPEVDTYDAYLRNHLGMPPDAGEKAH